ncbi:discoidin domain-containing protein [Glycomyces tritici]|uniref:Discoidin domain-containing protein n=1 Tax=Glycomyces tritici TaxID=2665176 RepID=A0ABT7YX77_9ACTN|nr:discoidin domain-containing protein [Glycomyces tritici]MDN3241218.1 discoidin domain-containing protein [Glycomyces tritici]MDN3243241.1 discoidin domain-containing protein [Glycomyces tritici]
MTQVDRRKRPRLIALAAALAAGIAVVAAPPPAHAQEQDPPPYAGLLTDHVVQVNETVSDAGFVHPGVGLSADDLRNAQDMVRTGQEPWASYFDAMTKTGATSKTYRATNSKSAAQPDVALDPNFNHGGLRGRETADSFGALSQSLMWVMTGNEVYRKNAIQALRTWASMNPDGFKYFPDAHIHTGKPLSQFLMAAEIIRATEPVADDTPGTHDGYSVEWTADDDANLLGNFAQPLVETFLYSPEKWMNQHNFGLYGRIATAIYADDTAAYAKGVEWFTVNSEFVNYTSGGLAQQIPLIEADDPANPYGEDFVQLREMGRDQAHAECNIDNFAALARFLHVQGTEVDPEDGTVSTADDAVSAYGFLGNRLLAGANAFDGYMMGLPTKYIDDRGTGGTVSPAYRGRMFNALNELYYQYKYVEGVDVETEAPNVALLNERMDGPLYSYGTGVNNFWSAGDKSVEYWVAFPPEIAGTEPAPVEDTALTFGNYGLPLDDGTEIVTEDELTFARATADADGTVSVVSRVMYPGSSKLGVRVRTDGPAVLEVLDKEERDPRNEAEPEPGVMARIELPDTQGEWRYITYPAAGPHTQYYRITGDGTTVDMDSLMFNAQTQLSPPVFEQARGRYYLWPDATSTFELGATDTGSAPAYTAAGLPEGAGLDAETGTLTWKPTPHDRGTHNVQIIADDGDALSTRTFEIVVAKNRPKMIDAAVADGTEEGAVYTTVSDEPYRAALAAARDASENGTDEEFRTAFQALLDAIEGLELLNPRLADGSLDYRNAVTPANMTADQARALADGNTHSHFGDLRVGFVTFDYGTRYRVSVEEFGLQARFSFPMRSQGTNVYGSNDGITWDLLTERPTGDTNDMETIPVVAEHRGKEYRYLKLQIDDPAPPIDPAYPGIWSLGEFHVFGDRSEVTGDIADVSVASPGALAGRVTAGADVNVTFTSAKPVSDVAVSVGGQALTATSEDSLSWTATGTLGDLTGGGRLDLVVDHTTEDGETAATIHGATDGTALYGSDESNLIDLADAEVVKADGTADQSKAVHAANMLDGKANTFSDVPAVDGQTYLVWDFGAGTQVSVDRIDYLARQDSEGVRRMDDQVIQGSNDLTTWTTVADASYKTLTWQNLPAEHTDGYRYLRVTNSAPIYIAELRLFGEPVYDIDPLLERADAVDLSGYTRGSQILFPREVAAVRAALAEPDADEQDLAQRLVNAWDLLDPAAAEAPAGFDQSWVAASTATADGATSAAANGWRMFDGNTGTWTDTTTKSCTNTVLPADGTAYTIVGVKYFPRDNAHLRATGLEIQGSNDGGATWTKFASTGTPVRGWNTVALAEPVHYGALRLSGGNGYCNVAELQFIVEVIDKSGLAVHLDDAAALTETDWTADTWAALVAARDAATTANDDKGATQEEVDTATEALAAAIDGLTKA